MKKTSVKSQKNRTEIFKQCLKLATKTDNEMYKRLKGYFISTGI